MAIQTISANDTFQVWLSRTNQIVGVVTNLTDGNLTVNGSITFTNATFALTVSSENVNQNLLLTSPAGGNTLYLLSSNAVVNGTVFTTGSGTSLMVSNNAVVSGNISIGGSTTTNTLTVTGAGNSLLVSNNIIIGGNTTTNNLVVNNSISAGVNISGANLTLTNNAVISGNVAGLDFTGRNLTFTGAGGFTGNVAGLDFTGRNLNFSGTGGFTGNVAGANFSGSEFSGSTLVLSGTAVTGGNLTSNNITSNNNITAQSINTPTATITDLSSTSISTTSLSTGGITSSGGITATTLDANIITGLTTPLSIAQGGTGANTANGAINTLAAQQIIYGNGTGTRLLGLSDTGNINGPNLAFYGPSGNKYVRAVSNELEIVNSAYTATIFIFDDAGNFTAVGNVTAYSDIRLKVNIIPLQNSTEKLLRIRGVEFDYIRDGRHSVGLIAQEVEKEYPDLILDKHGIKTLDYSRLVAPLIESIRELNARIELLEKAK